MQLTPTECLNLMGGHAPPTGSDHRQLSAYWDVFTKRVVAAYGEQEANAVLLLAGGLPGEWDASWRHLATLNSIHRKRTSA